MKHTKFMAMATAMMLMLVSAVTACANTSTASKSAEGDPAEAVEAEAVESAGVDEGSGPMIPASDTMIRPGMKPEKVTVIDFNATWCGPCRMFAPAFDKAAERYGKKADFYSIDTDQFPATATAFQVQAIPTVVIILPDGQTRTFVGLGDFAQGISDNATQEEVTEALTKNFCEAVAAALKK